jgi:hypothetical protein
VNSKSHPSKFLVENVIGEKYEKGECERKRRKI